MRALAAFYLIAGRSTDALRITSRAVVLPDRRGHNSRDPAIDRAIVALLDRATRRMQAGVVLENGAGGPWREALAARFSSATLSFESWQSGRQVVEHLASRDILVGVLQIGLAKGGITPPWLASDIGEVIGPAAMRSALRRARATDSRRAARGYYDAMEAESWLDSGDSERAIALARRALVRLPDGEGLILARLHVVLARAFEDLGRARDAGRAFETAIAADPSVLRRLDVALPATIRSGGGGMADAIVSRLRASGRFDDDEATFAIQVRAGRGSSEICVRGPSRTLGCAHATRARGDDDDAFARRAVRALYDEVFAPRLGLTARDIAALEGPTRTERRPLDTVFGRRRIEVETAP